MTLKINDLGIGQLRADLETLRGTEITVGWQGSSGAEAHPGADGASIAQVGAWMEFGTDKVPARPAVRTTLDRFGSAFTEAARKAVSDLVDGRATVDELGLRLGEVGVQALRQTLDDAARWAEALAPSTVARKGHDQPLLDTGTLRDKASWAVRRGERIVEQGGEE